jgi:hypothetical protein
MTKIINLAKEKYGERDTFRGKKGAPLLRINGKLFIVHCRCNPVANKYQKKHIFYGELIKGYSPICKDCGLFGGIVPVFNP